MALLWVECADGKVPEAQCFYFSVLPMVEVSKPYNVEEEKLLKDSAAENNKTGRREGGGWKDTLELVTGPIKALGYRNWHDK